MKAYSGLLMLSFLVAVAWISRWVEASETWIFADNFQDSVDGSCNVTNVEYFSALANVSVAGSTCNLRSAVDMSLNSGVPIALAAGSHMITEGQIQITADTSIYGMGQSITIINGSKNSLVRLFYVVMDVNLDLRLVTVADFTSNLGGAGIYTEGSVTVYRVFFLRCIVENAEGRNRAGAIAVGYDAARSIDPQVYVTNVTFQACKTSGQGGALGLFSAQTGYITDSLFEDCSANQRGGAIAMELKSTNLELMVTGTTFRSTRGTNGGAIALQVKANSAVSFSATIARCSFKDAFADTGFGGALSFEGGAKENRDSSLLVQSTTFENDRAITKGGGVFVSGRTDVSLSSVKFKNCSSGDLQGAGLYVGTEYKIALDSSFDVKLTDVTFDDMHSRSSTAIYNDIFINSSFFQLDEYSYELDCSYTNCPGGSTFNNSVNAACLYSDAESGLSSCDCVSAVDCLSCIPGKASIGGFSSCKDCPPGKYSASFSGENCIDCLPGKYASANASTKCNLCTFGRFSESTGSNYCLNCSAGKYLNSKGADSSCSCTDCPR